MSFDIICFDCDSTLSKIEGIDELGRQVDKFDDMAALTNAAMNGELALEQVYGKRLEVIKPDNQLIDWLADLYISERVDGVEQVFEQLLKAGKSVHIISGGIRQAILPLANRLGLSDDQVHAVNIRFDQQGQYADFDQQSPLAKTGGKATICRMLKTDSNNMVMIGDGKTDLEAKEAGATVIGFGGVAKRQIVMDKADQFVADHSLLSVLPFIL